MSDSVWPHRWRPARLPSWDSPDKNTGVGCHFLLQFWKLEVYNQGVAVWQSPGAAQGLGLWASTAGGTGSGNSDLASCVASPPTPARAKKGVAGLVSSVAALLCLQMAAFSLCPPVVTPWSVLLCPLLVSHQLYWTRSCPYDLILPLLSLQRSCLQIHSHSELLVASDQTYDFGGSTFSPQQGSTDVFPILNLPIHEQYSHLF